MIVIIITTFSGTELGLEQMAFLLFADYIFILDIRKREEGNFFFDMNSLHIQQSRHLNIKKWPLPSPTLHFVFTGVLQICARMRFFLE